MKLRFYGSRGSHCTSTSPERIEELIKEVWNFSKKNPNLSWVEFEKKLKDMPHAFSGTYSTHTTCIEIDSPLSPMPLFIDMGTGLSAAAADPKSGINNKDFQNSKGRAAFFVSHTHWDHIIGLPTFFRIHQPGNEFHFYGCHKNLKKRLSTLFHQHYFPVSFETLEERFHFHELKKNEQIPFGNLKISTASQPHPGTSYAYRFQEDALSFVIATDTDLSNTMGSEFAHKDNIYSNADLLAIDSHFTSEDYRTRKDHGHPSCHMAIDFAVAEEVKHLLFTHHNPMYSDKKLDDILTESYKYLYDTHGESHPLKLSYPLEGKEIHV